MHQLIRSYCLDILCSTSKQSHYNNCNILWWSIPTTTSSGTADIKTLQIQRRVQDRPLEVARAAGVGDSARSARHSQRDVPHARSMTVRVPRHYYCRVLAISKLRWVGKKCKISFETDECHTNPISFDKIFDLGVNFYVSNNPRPNQFTKKKLVGKKKKMQ